jgi:hypothetical protein
VFFPVSFHSQIEVCDFLGELLLNRSFRDLAGARTQGFFQVLNLFYLATDIIAGRKKMNMNKLEGKTAIITGDATPFCI